MSPTDIAGAVWRKSTRSGSTGGNCVEVAYLGAAVGIRDSKNQTGPALEFATGAFAAFIDEVKAGEFDLT